ncbi:MAG: rod shape-determining protein RodA [Chloroherpetonaceae bacterium]|nr:rod shape-determining protein RodA [Chloroherpetonaceae bacterium]
MQQALYRRLDWPLLVLTYLLATIGLVVLYSAAHTEPVAYHQKQFIRIVLGTVALVSATLIDYHLLARFARHLYLLNLLLLLLVLKVGDEVKGASRWISIAGFPFQPSEFAKLFVIFTLGVFLTKHRETITQIGTLVRSLVHVAVPMALIFKQPDLATSLVLIAIWTGMVFMAGARIRHLVGLAVCGLLLFAGFWHSGILKDYQKTRILVLIRPDADPKGSGYHIRQARIAIGSGGMWGKGLKHGTQVQGGFVPEHHTDFIFTNLSEELGFVGAVTVLVLYLLLLLRGVQLIASVGDDPFGKFVAAGIVSMLAFHVVVNVGMNVGILPVAGVPLLLLSYGGSNIVLTLLSVGVLQSIAVHRRQLHFSPA